MRHLTLNELKANPNYNLDVGKGRPFLYLNGSLFYGEPGEHHGEVINRYDLTKFPSHENNTSGRVWPEDGVYWMDLHGEKPGMKEALEREFPYAP